MTTTGRDWVSIVSIFFQINDGLGGTSSVTTHCQTPIANLSASVHASVTLQQENWNSLVVVPQETLTLTLFTSEGNPISFYVDFGDLNGVVEENRTGIDNFNKT